LDGDDGTVVGWGECYEPQQTSSKLVWVLGFAGLTPTYEIVGFTMSSYFGKRSSIVIALVCGFSMVLHFLLYPFIGTVAFIVMGILLFAVLMKLFKLKAEALEQQLETENHCQLLLQEKDDEIQQFKQESTASAAAAQQLFTTELQEKDKQLEARQVQFAELENHSKQLLENVTKEKDISREDMRLQLAELENQAKHWQEEISLLTRENQAYEKLLKNPNVVAQMINTRQSLDEAVCVSLEKVLQDTENSTSDIIQKVRFLDSSASEIVNYLNSANEHSQRMQEGDERIGVIIQEVGGFIKGLPQQMREEHSHIKELIKNIGSFIEKLEVVNKIGFETKILSLNASIEAARAGSQFRGFSVIAQEIRHLADKSSEATSLIQKDVNQLHCLMNEEFSQKYEQQLSSNEAQANCMGGAITELTNNYQEMKQFYKTVIPEVTQSNIHLAEQIVDTLGCMQFQDIVRQKIERMCISIGHANAELDQFKAGLEDPGKDNAASFATLLTIVAEYIEQEGCHSDYSHDQDSPAAMIELF